MDSDQLPITRREFATYERYSEKLIDTKADAIKLALEQKATEYEAHFNLLNHEHHTNIQNWLTSVRKEMYEENKKTMDAAIADMQKYLNKLQGALYLVGLAAASGLLGWVYVAIKGP